MKPGRVQPAAVPVSSDLERVLRLPRRPPLDLGSARALALSELETERLRREDRRHDGSDCACASMSRRCLSRLLPVQAWALREARLLGGLVGLVGVGHGKTLMGLLAPLVVPGCRHAVILVPPGLVGQLVEDYLAAREHLRVPSLVAGDRSWLEPAGAPVLRVVPYSQLSRPESTRLLDDVEADLVVADEAHHLRSLESARTRRFVRMFVRRPETRLLAWSGTLTKSSLREFAHVLAVALGDGSPLPLEPSETERWAAAVDPSEWPAPPGALARLAGSVGADPGDVREAVRRRLVQTPGVVSTGGADKPCPASVVVRERRPPPAPPAVLEAARLVRRTWTRPDGEELVEAADVARVLREVLSGFYYRWVFKKSPPEGLVDRWFDARKAWNKELRRKLARAVPHLDSPHLCALAAERARRGEDPRPDAPTWESEAWQPWLEVRDLVEYDVEAVWIDRWLARDAAAWAAEAAAGPGVVWYVHGAFGRAIGEAAGLPVFSGGDREEMFAAAARREPLVLSQRAYGTGLDGLQRTHSRCLFSEPPSSGDAWEQTIGRLHRRGQEADEVVCDVYRHAPEVAAAVDRAAAGARYVEEVTGARQTLLSADVEWDLASGLRAAAEARPAPPEEEFK